MLCTCIPNQFSHKETDILKISKPNIVIRVFLSAYELDSR